MSDELIPSEKLMRFLLAKHSARETAERLRARGYTVTLAQLQRLRGIMLANGQAKRLMVGKRNPRSAPVNDPTICAAKSSAALLRRQLETGQCGFTDPRHIAALLLDLAA